MEGRGGERERERASRVTGVSRAPISPVLSSSPSSRLDFIPFSLKQKLF